MSININIKDSEKLLIAFTGFSETLGMKTEIFLKKSGLENTSNIIISDPSKCMCLNGLGESLQDFYFVLKFLKQQIKNLKPKTIVVTGTSRGAYSAILFSHLLRADFCVVFAPYPYLEKKKLKEMGDVQSLKSLKNVFPILKSLHKKIKAFYDLTKVLASWNGKTKYIIHVSKNNVWDLKRAISLKNMPKVKIIKHNYAEHNITLFLAKQNKLSNCFKFGNRSLIFEILDKFISMVKK